MEDFLKEIEYALNNNLYQISIAACLSIPDICGALESKDGEATKSKYINWYNHYVKRKNDHLTGVDCYYLRCSQIHQHRNSHKKVKYSKVLFSLRINGCVFHNNIIHDALNLDVEIFCNNIIIGCRDWFREMNESKNKNFERNYKNFSKFSFEFEHYIKGVPMIS